MKSFVLPKVTQKQIKSGNYHRKRKVVCEHAKLEIRYLLLNLTLELVFLSLFNTKKKPNTIMFEFSGWVAVSFLNLNSFLTQTKMRINHYVSKCLAPQPILPVL